MKYLVRVQTKTEAGSTSMKELEKAYKASAIEEFESQICNLVQVAVMSGITGQVQLVHTEDDIVERDFTFTSTVNL